MKISRVRCLFVFDPTKRIFVTEALQHPYLAGLCDPNQTPPARVPIDLELDENMKESTIREMIWQILSQPADPALAQVEPPPVPQQRPHTFCHHTLASRFEVSTDLVAYKH
uniref:Uncharacterized protein n=1 Tax=Kalanchoe fedtschenkoi TaxID=63787 RepID=A0A7N0UDQ0_KALFE